MIPLNKKIKLPWASRFYGLAWLFIILLAITLLGSVADNGMATFVSVGWIMVLVALWLLLDYACISYVVSEKMLTINSGILIKSSKSIPYASVQNVNNTSGPIAMIFGVGRINIWTSSQEQIQISRGNSRNKPSGSLLLAKTDAEWLKDYILKNK